MAYKDLEKRRAYMREYGLTYFKTEKARETLKRYRNTESYRLAQRKRMRKKHFLQKYGLTLEGREALLTSQGFACAACGNSDPGSKKGWCIDHDHTRNDPHARGILCQGCNCALGNVGDNVSRLQALIGYLERINDAHSAGNELRRPREHTEDVREGGSIPHGPT